MRVRAILDVGASYRFLGLVCRYEGRAPDGHHRFRDPCGTAIEVRSWQVIQYVRSGELSRETERPRC